MASFLLRPFSTAPGSPWCLCSPHLLFLGCVSALKSLMTVQGGGHPMGQWGAWLTPRSISLTLTSRTGTILHFTDGEKTENVDYGNGNWLGLLFSYLFFHESRQGPRDCLQTVGKSRLSESRVSRERLVSQGPHSPDRWDPWQSVDHSVHSSVHCAVPWNIL